MPANAPNIIVILSDQLRRDALGIYGDRNVRTPHIDRLAEGGRAQTLPFARAGQYDQAQQWKQGRL